MSPSRRDFLKVTSSAAALGLLAQHSTTPGYGAELFGLEPPGPVATPGDAYIKELAMKALDAAKAAGATYADVRFGLSRVRWSDATDRTIEVTRLKNLAVFGVRVIAGGAWGFASSRDLTAEEAPRVAKLAVEQAKINQGSRGKPVALAPAAAAATGHWETPVKINAWTKTVDDQLTFQLHAHDIVLKPGGTGCISRFVFWTDDITFASTEGAYTTQTLHAFGGYFYVTAMADDREYFAYVQPPLYPEGGFGWEGLTDNGFLESLPKAVEDMKRLAKAKAVEVGRFDVVLDGYVMGTGPLAESLGKAVQLDRALGYEMSRGGTSYLNPPEKTLGQYTFKNPKINIKGSRSVPKAFGTVKWDEEGTAPTEFDLVKAGVVVDYMTTREFAQSLDWWYKQRKQPVRSNGCAGSMAVNLAQTVTPATPILEPGEKDVSIDELIADIKKGIYFESGGFASVDPPLMNGEYTSSGGLAYEIKNGKKGDLVKYAAFQARTPDLWKSIDAVGGKKTQVTSAYVEAKGDPIQIIPRSAVSPAVRIRQVNVTNYGRRG